MKTALIVLALLVAGFFWYEHANEGAEPGPPIAKDPYYLEVRATNNLGGREVELALFARALNERDCLDGSNAGWANIRRSCPTCTAEAPKCSKELSPRYARLFDDQSIPSTYLSATAANARERDLRVVVYGLTDDEGMVICEAMHKELAKNFTGLIRCVPPSD